MIFFDCRNLPFRLEDDRFSYKVFGRQEYCTSLPTIPNVPITKQKRQHDFVANTSHTTMMLTLPIGQLIYPSDRKHYYDFV